MKSTILIGLLFIAGFACSPPAEDTSQEEAESPVQNGIQWTGDNEVANYLAMRGIGHMMNIEFEKAYTFFDEAVKVDPTLFAPHVALSFFSDGDKKAYHEEMARKHVVGKNETSQLFASLLDIPADSTGQEQAAEAWAKMHELSNGPFIHFRYALSRTDTTEAMAELDKLEAFLTENGWNTGHIHNIRAYMHTWTGDMDAASQEVDKYMEVYDGYNPLDSRAEIYLMAGDTASAVEYYKKVVEVYPWAWSANNALDKLDPEGDN